VVAHLTRYTPLSSNRFVKLFAAFVEYFLSDGRTVALALNLGATHLTTSSGAVLVVCDHLTVV
jgi:hypothetical protein